MNIKNLSILGSTGSIGRQTLDIVRRFPERFRVTALSAGANADEMARQVREFNPLFVSMSEPAAAEKLGKLLPEYKGVIVSGAEGAVQSAVHAQADFIVSAIVGAAGIEPTYAAIKAGKTVALANKETMVAAGRLISDALKAAGASLLPVDSEHSAIFQCLQGSAGNRIHKIYLTSSGGPFRTWDAERLKKATLADALAHPVWSMGRKVTVDSSTMMNKGLEVIEARWIFDVAPADIQIVVHPKSIVHSMVQFADGCIIAQAGTPDMRSPIAYAMSWPERLRLDFSAFNPLENGAWEFYPPDAERFPCWRLAYEALEMGDFYPAVLNAANEIAVQAFLDGVIAYSDIAALNSAILALAFREGIAQNADDIAAVLQIDGWARASASEMVKTNSIPHRS